jgi:hypothetical protein
MTIDVTNEMVQLVYERIDFWDHSPNGIREGLAAVLAIVERDYSVSRRLTADEIASLPKLTRRLKACVENWPDAEEGAYDPRCCRWPKSCSATIYRPDRVADADLEPERF